MKFANFVSLFLVCVLVVYAVDGRKHQRHKKRGMERVRSEEAVREIVPKLTRNTHKATDAVSLDVVKADNKATAENKGISLNEQDAAITVTDSQEKPEELPIQSKHRRGHKRRKGFPFHKRDGGLHKRTHGFHKRNHGDRKREYPVNNGERLKLRSNPKNLKKLMKLIKRAEHMRMRQNREQHKKDITP